MTRSVTVPEPPSPGGANRRAGLNSHSPRVLRKPKSSRLRMHRCYRIVRAARSMEAEAGRERCADGASGSARRIEVEDVKALFAEQKGHLDYFFDEVRARFPFDPLAG